MSFREWRKSKYSAKAVVMDESLAEHDAKYHPNGFDPEKDECKLRESMAKEGAKDDLKSDSNVMSEEDAEYMEAVKNGDMEKAERMVREAAAKAMPNTKIVDGEGQPAVVYHGTTWNPNEEKNGDAVFSGADGVAYFTMSEVDAREFGDSVLKFFVNMRNPYYADFMTIYDENENEVGSIDSADWNGTELKWLKAHDYDGVVDDDDAKIFNFIIDPTQIKSADPVTYDDAGNVIPLSKRFDSKSNDIRF